MKIGLISVQTKHLFLNCQVCAVTKVSMDIQIKHSETGKIKKATTCDQVNALKKRRLPLAVEQVCQDKQKIVLNEQIQHHHTAAPFPFHFYSRCHVPIMTLIFPLRAHKVKAGGEEKKKVSFVAAERVFPRCAQAFGDIRRGLRVLSVQQPKRLPTFYNDGMYRFIPTNKPGKSIIWLAGCLKGVTFNGWAALKEHIPVKLNLFGSWVRRTFLVSEPREGAHQ